MANEKARHPVCCAVYWGVNVGRSEGERMSDTLHRAVADASCIIVKQDDQIQRALQVLQSVDRKSTEWGVVEYAIQILQEGQQ